MHRIHSCLFLILATAWGAVTDIPRLADISYSSAISRSDLSSIDINNATAFALTVSYKCFTH